ncbi:hypothetical protein AGMMS49944_19360 [Spirochaetia bacterium]|nr:hypothetical protein AGMMS49944_19360 [Spirochaetia bacterium]
MAILFWGVNKILEDGTRSKTEKETKYFFLSNFAPSPIKATFFGKEITFPTAEHYYQANKFPDDETKFMEIAAAKSPRQAANKGREFSGLRPDWKTARDEIMEAALILKFSQNPDLARQLKDTGTEEIIEASSRDNHFGWGKNHKGENVLGKLLMKTRNYLSNT